MQINHHRQQIYFSFHTRNEKLEHVRTLLYSDCIQAIIQNFFIGRILIIFAIANHFVAKSVRHSPVVLDAIAVRPGRLLDALLMRRAMSRRAVSASMRRRGRRRRRRRIYGKNRICSKNFYLEKPSFYSRFHIRKFAAK